MGAGNAGGTGSGGNSQYTTSREIGLTNQYTKDQTKKKKTTVVNNGGDGGQTAGAESGNNTITQVTQTAPTVAEVSQATTAEADADTEANRLLKIKKKGRSRSIMTSAKGVTKTSSDYSLGKPSLLGRV